jgi:hypothetical protein
MVNFSVYLLHLRIRVGKLVAASLISEIGEGLV